MTIDTGTRLYGVFGNPVSHSLSPVMHNAAFAHAGYNAVYLAFKIEDIAAAVSAVRAFDVQGVSVTIPHKVAIMPHLDETDPLAKQIGAVNTVINRDGILSGYNSDCLGAVRALREKTEIGGRKTAVIGAGGAARAIGFGIKAEKGRVCIVNRSAEKGEKLAKEMNADFLPLAQMNADFDIVINTTPLGMTPDTERMPLSPDLLREEMTVMDIVYNPLQTRLLKEAEKRGCVTVDGLSMFVYQGAFQFELWTGKSAPLDLMRKTVLQALRIANQQQVGSAKRNPTIMLKN